MLNKVGNDRRSFADTSEGRTFISGILARVKGAVNIFTNKSTFSSEFDLRSSGVKVSSKTNNSIKNDTVMPKTPGYSMSNTMRNQLS